MLNFNNFLTADMTTVARRIKSSFALISVCTAVTAGFVPSAYADNQRPSTVNGIYTVTQGDGAIEVNWNRPWDDTGIDGYNIYRDGSYISTVTTTQFIDRNTSIGNTYNYSISAFDPARNYSELSPEIQASASGNGNNNNNNELALRQTNNDASQNSSSPIPTGLRGEEVSPGTVRWEWNWVPSASQYEVTVDGSWAGVTSDTHFFSRDLWRGDHSLTVKSITADNNYSSQSDTLKFNVAADASAGSSQNVAPPAPQADTQAAAPPAPAANDNGLIDPASWSQPGIGRDGYELVFSDEFNANAINPARWDTNFRWDGEFNGERFEYRIINNEDQFYVSPLSVDQEHQNLLPSLHNPFEFDGSRLAIRATRNPLKTSNERRLYGPLRDVMSTKEFLSGALSTHNTFARKYGYFEARIRIPSAVGTFPAFWLYHHRRRSEGTHRTEIDIMESLGHAPWFIYNSFHFFNNVSTTYAGDANFLRPEPEGQIFTGTDYSQNYHVYAVRWEPGYVEWSIDGVKTSELRHPAIDNEPLYIMLNLAMGGNWVNFPTNAGGLGREQSQRYPTAEDLNQHSNPTLEIDYVRVYAPR